MNSSPAPPAPAAGSTPPLAFDPRSGEVWIEMRPGRRGPAYRTPQAAPSSIRLALADPRGTYQLIERIGADLRRRRLSGRTCVPGGSCRIFIDGLRPVIECDDSVRLRVGADDTAVFMFKHDGSPVAAESLVLTPFLLRDPLPPASTEQIERLVHVRREAARESWDLRPDVDGAYWVAPQPDGPFSDDHAVRAWIAGRHQAGDPLMAEALAFLAEYGTREHEQITALDPVPTTLPPPLTATERILLPLWSREIASGRITVSHEPDAGVMCKLFLDEIARVAGDGDPDRFAELLDNVARDDWAPSSVAGGTDPVDARDRGRDAVERLVRRLGRPWFESETAGFVGWRDALIEWMQAVDAMVAPPGAPDDGPGPPR